jgi:hypothetical protein
MGKSVYKAVLATPDTFFSVWKERTVNSTLVQGEKFLFIKQVLSMPDLFTNVLSWFQCF